MYVVVLFRSINIDALRETLISRRAFKAVHLPAALNSELSFFKSPQRVCNHRCVITIRAE